MQQQQYLVFHEICQLKVTVFVFSSRYKAVDLFHGSHAFLFLIVIIFGE